MNAIAYADEWAEEARTAARAAASSDGASWDYNAVRAAIQARIAADYPMYLGIVTSVTYNEKVNRYVIKFDTSSARITNDVAAYLLTEGNRASMKPTVYAHMADGVIDAVLLLYLSRS